MSAPSDSRPQDDVLLIKNVPFSRAERDSLLAFGVGVSHLTPDQVEGQLRNENQRGAIVDRLATAKVCVLDTGTSLGLASAILRIREGRPGRIIATTEYIGRIAEGMALSQMVVGGPPGRCDVVRDKATLLSTLRGLGDPHPVVLEAPGANGPITRPAKPLQHISDPEEYSYRELYLSGDGHPEEVEWDTRLVTGRIPAEDLLTPGARGRFRNLSPLTVLKFLIKHLPSADLPLLTSDDAGEWWTAYANALPTRFPMRVQHEPLGACWREVETLLWHAIARDGGVTTLARLPASLVPRRDEVAAKWDAAVQEATERMSLEIASPEARTIMESIGSRVLKEWNVVPCEDPLAADADPNRFRPSRTTLEVARRYRSAPEVILAARERWGGRPYQGHAAANQLEDFVCCSPPASAEELDAWIRVLQTLPDGRMRTCVLRGMAEWRRIEIALLEARNSPEDEGENIAAAVPCLDRKGDWHPRYWQQITSGRLRGSIGNIGAWAQRMGYRPHYNDILRHARRVRG